MAVSVQMCLCFVLPNTINTYNLVEEHTSARTSVKTSFDVYYDQVIIAQWLAQLATGEVQGSYPGKREIYSFWIN